MKVQNMLSTRGNRVANQFVIDLGNKTALQSYETLVAVYDKQIDTMYEDKERYSPTTSKYINLFKQWANAKKFFKVENSELHKLVD